MARIPDEEVTRLKAEVSIVSLVEASGIELRTHGADRLGLCPFHDDREPSLVVSASKNLWHCMGACSTGGSVIDWVMRTEGISFRHAVELLRAGHEPTPRDRRAPVRKVANVLPASFKADANDNMLLASVLDYYHQALKESPEALDYLRSRGLGSPEMIETFRIGFANRTLGYRLPSKTTKEGQEVRERLIRLGIIRQSGHEHFNGSIVVPIFSEDSALVEYYGRKITRSLRKGTPDHLYLPGPHAGVWNIAALVSSPEVIVCESLIDAMSFWVAGLRNVTSSYGTSGFTPAHLDAMRTHGTKRVLIAYDHDQAGDTAAAALAERLQYEVGIECFRVQFPPNSDANDVLVTDGPDALHTALRRSSWLGARPAPGGLSFAAALQVSPSQSPTPATSFVDDAGLGASPVPPSPVESAPGATGDELQMTFGDRRWRVRGLSKVTSFDLLRLNVFVARDDERTGQLFHVDTFDLYTARVRALFVKQAADELALTEDTIKRDLGRVLLACEEAAKDAVAQATEPPDNTVVLSAEETAAALEFLRDPNLTARILSDFETIGVVGEETNKLVGYLAAVSRKLEAPLAVMVRSSSAAGKSSLLDAVVGFVPEEDRVAYSAMTGQSLFYMGERDLAHKVLAIAEEEGASRAAYALKLLQSEGELSIASTGKDATSGRLVTHTYSVKGPVAILTTTTAADIDEELLNRCIVLSVDEEREQTRAIHDRQRHGQTISGLLSRQSRVDVITLHQNAQRLLQPLLVANPYAPQLGFADRSTRTRRDHMKYLSLIRVIGLLHQHQREHKTASHDGRTITYIEVTPSDIALANKLAANVLGRSLDELAPQSRRLLEVIDEMVNLIAKERDMQRGEVRFTRRELREHCNWSDTQLKVHLARLVELELAYVHKATTGTHFLYELCWQSASGTALLGGLIDPANIDYDSVSPDQNPDRSAQEAPWSAPGRWAVGLGRNEESDNNSQLNGAVSPPAGGDSEKRTSGEHRIPVIGDVGPTEVAS